MDTFNAASLLYFMIGEEERKEELYTVHLYIVFRQYRLYVLETAHHLT